MKCVKLHEGVGGAGREDVGGAGVGGEGGNAVQCTWEERKKGRVWRQNGRGSSNFHRAASQNVSFTANLSKQDFCDMYSKKKEMFLF